MPEGAYPPWGAEALWQQLEPLLPGLSVEVVARADSTNTRLLERARGAGAWHDGAAAHSSAHSSPTNAAGQRAALGRRSGDTLPCLLVAERQTHGRGRLGRDWHAGASAGDSLTFSLSLPLAPADWAGLSLAAGLALADALDPLALPAESLDPLALPAESLDPDPRAAPRIVLKWPNDLWLSEGPGRGRKLGGILIETVSVGGRRLCVVGVGLNVRAQPADGPSAGSACLQEIAPTASAPAALAAVAVPLVRALLRFEREGFAPLAAAYARRDLLLGQPVATTAAEVARGLAEGVDHQGALCVRAGDVLHRLVSGEVSVRPRPGAAPC